MKNSTIIITVAGFFLSLSSLFAQQDPQFSQYMFNKLSFNPGFAGHSGGICINGIIREQWVGFEEKDSEGNTYNVAPETFMVTVDAPVRVLKGAISGIVMQESIGHQSDIDLKLGYTFRTSLGQGNLGAGFQIAFFNRTVNFSEFEVIDQNDPITKLGEESDMLFDFSLGLYYEVPDQFYIGLSAVDLLQSEGKPLVATEGSGGVELKYTLDRSIYLTGGYNYTLPGNPNFEIKPSFLVKLGQATNQYDVSAIVAYKERFWGGISYRFEESVVAILGLEIKNFRIGYSYDVMTTNYGLGGSHEIMLGYCFKLQLEKARKSYYNTRFL